MTGPARRLRPGQWVCSPDHGVVTPLTDGPVPVCPHCRRMVLLAVRPPGRAAEYVIVQEPVPGHCDGPDRHPFGPGLVRVGWSPCDCPGRPHSNGHRTWGCERCPSQIVEGVTTGR